MYNNLMALDGITIAALCAELNNKLKGGRISKIAQPEADELLFTIKTPEGNYKLLMSASATLPFLYITDESIPSPMTAPSFCMLLRKHISSGRIISITQPSLERIIDFTIEHLNEMGDVCQKVLTVELMGKHSNIIFREPDGKIIDSIKHVSALVSSVREVLPGREYFIPNSEGKLNPRTVSKEEFTSALSAKGMSLSKAIYTTLTGLSPAMAEEICYRSGIDSNISAISLSEDMLLHLYNNLSWIMEDINNESFTPCIITDTDGKPSDFASLVLNIYSDKMCEKYDSISVVLKEYYSRRNVYTRIRQKSTDLRKIVQTHIERDAKKLDLQQKQLKDTEKMDKYQLYGELLTAYGHSIISGSKEAVVNNYYTGEDIKIPLDEDLSPLSNAQKYYEKYGKLKRTKEAVTLLLTQTAEELEHLESISESLEIAINEDDLMQIRQELIDCGYIKKHSNNKQKSRFKSEPFHYISSDGFDIYVGRNNYQNDELTFKFANGSDWWFHAKKMPGSHVILKTNGREVSDKAFEEAASLAAYYSKGAKNGKVEIDYVQRKEVKKPAGAKPGFVVYYTNYSMIANADISSLSEEHGK